MNEELYIKSISQIPVKGIIAIDKMKGELCDYEVHFPFAEVIYLLSNGGIFTFMLGVEDIALSECEVIDFYENGLDLYKYANEVDVDLALYLIDNCRKDINKDAFLSNILARCEHHGVFVYPDARAVIEKEINVYYKRSHRKRSTERNMADK